MPGSLAIGVPLPQKGCTLGSEISECDYYLLQFINKSEAGFPFYKHSPSDYRNNSWILSINNIEPTSAENTIHILRSSQHKKDNCTINIYLAKRGPALTKTRLTENRCMFKQVEFHPSRVITSKTAAFFSITLSVNKVIFTPNRSIAPKDM
eukprot:299493-Ditylum_brightwellii.AAC.1